MKKYFFTGLAIFLPLAITFFIIVFLLDLLTKPFMGLVTSMLTDLDWVQQGFFFLSPAQVTLYGSKFLVLVFLAVLIFALGFFGKWFFIPHLLRLIDKIVHKIPIINSVYKTSKDMIRTLFDPEKKSFKQVVLAPFPNKKSYVLGLIASEAPEECSSKIEKDLISVLIPTTPNPTTGFLLMYHAEDLIYLDMKPEEALKYVISCGLILPNPKEACS